MADLTLKAEHLRLFHDAQRLGIGGGATVDLLKQVDLAPAQVLIRVLAWYITSDAGGHRAGLRAELPDGGTLEGLTKALAGVVKDHDATIKGWLPKKELKSYDELCKQLLG
jgi:hypothetical protein